MGKRRKMIKPAVSTRCNVENRSFFTDPIHTDTHPFLIVFSSKQRVSSLCERVQSTQLFILYNFASKSFSKKSGQHGHFGSSTSRKSLFRAFFVDLTHGTRSERSSPSEKKIGLGVTFHSLQLCQQKFLEKKWATRSIGVNHVEKSIFR